MKAVLRGPLVHSWEIAMREAAAEP